MSSEKKQKTKKIYAGLVTVVLIIAVVLTSFTMYVNDYYKADPAATSVMVSTTKMSIKTLIDDTIVYMPKGAKTGLIFYPGGKVEYTAYLPLMEACASRGIACVLLKMPFNLAVLDMNAADGIQELYPEISEWYIGGHSLGGSMAASYLSENTQDFEGLILLGSYSTADFSETSLKVLSVYGSKDMVLNREKYNENKNNLPENFTETILDGGCHAYFGMYGEQEGDGTPEISNQEQIEKTADAIEQLLK